MPASKNRKDSKRIEKAANESALATDLTGKSNSPQAQKLNKLLKFNALAAARDNC
jgi:hypothetical protein